jgi:hypothetical protein
MTLDPAIHAVCIHGLRIVLELCIAVYGTFLAVLAYGIFRTKR